MTEPSTPSTEPSIAARRSALLHALASRPHDFDFFALLRQIDALWSTAPRMGSALRPNVEPVRFGQDPELSFAPAALSSFQSRAELPPRVGVRFFGLFGPMGPLPLHLTEQARDRLRNHADATLARFADIFHHRMLLLFYRAWSQSQPTVQADRPADDRFAKWIGALFGQGPSLFRKADAVPDHAKRFVSGHLGRATRSAESVEKVLRQYFSVPICVETHVGHWMALRMTDRSRLGLDIRGGGARLGVSAIAGSKVWDRQYKLRVHLGPLTLAQYRQFLPGQRPLLELRDWLRQLLGFEVFWDVRLVLRAGEVPFVRIGERRVQGAALGLDTWLGQRAPRTKPGELQLHQTHLSTRHPPKGLEHG